MKKALSILSVVFAVSIISFIAFLGWHLLKTAGLSFGINRTISEIAEYSKEIGDFADETGKWYVLTDTETALVFSDENIKIDNFSIFSSQPQDIKVRNLKIAVKKNSPNSYELMVWSRGFDNISGTDDDIICSGCDRAVINQVK